MDELVINRAIDDLLIFEDNGSELDLVYSEPQLEGRVVQIVDVGGGPEPSPATLTSIETTSSIS